MALAKEPAVNMTLGEQIIWLDAFVYVAELVVKIVQLPSEPPDQSYYVAGLYAVALLTPECAEEAFLFAEFFVEILADVARTLVVNGA